MNVQTKLEKKQAYWRKQLTAARRKRALRSRILRAMRRVIAKFDKPKSPEIEDLDFGMF